MINRIEGRLLTAEDGRAEIVCGALTYELLIPASDMQALATRLGEDIEFHTLHYLEGQGQGTSFIPRLIGFQSPRDREFFMVFTTVKGMGNRKALRALQLPFHRVADAISLKDLNLLKSLPEIGKRTAETIVAELNGKIDQFIELKPDTMTGAATTDVDPGARQLVDAATQILTQLGESRADAAQLVERALAADSTIDSADALVTAAFRLKALP